MKKPEKLYEGNMRKKYLLFAIPLILSALLSQSYNFVNSMMIGKFIGSEAFAATAVTSELIEFLSSVFGPRKRCRELCCKRKFNTIFISLYIL